MTRLSLLAATCALTGLVGFSALPAAAQAPLVATAQGPQRMMLGAIGDRRIREVMFGDTGSTIEIIYDMPAGSPQSRRVLRLQNVNGMLEVIYDEKMPSQMSLGSGGTPRLVAKTDGMYEVVYEK